MKGFRPVVKRKGKKLSTDRVIRLMADSTAKCKVVFTATCSSRTQHCVIILSGPAGHNDELLITSSGLH